MVRGGALMEGDGNKQNRHLLRSSASACRPLAGASGNIRTIQDLLGQSNIQAVVIYAYGLSSSFCCVPASMSLYGIANLMVGGSA